MKAYQGPVNYVDHHPVHNPGSLSTPYRVVVNSSLDNNNQGISVNDMWPKGPNSCTSHYLCGSLAQFQESGGMGSVQVLPEDMDSWTPHWYSSDQGEALQAPDLEVWEEGGEVHHLWVQCGHLWGQTSLNYLGNT